MLCPVFTAMKTYRIEPTGEQFSVIDSHGNVVDILPTRQAAEAEIHRCLKEDVVWESAKLLFGTAIRAHMELHALDRETSRRLMQDAAEVAD